jgi:iron-sulfur cluster repair protein YtfE (RIC family)
LITYLEDNSHRYIRQTLRQLDQLIEKIARARPVPLRLVDWLRRQSLALEDLLETHLAHQECCLFPMISELTGQGDNRSAARELGESLQEAMERATLANQEAITLTETMQKCLRHAEWEQVGALTDRLEDKVRELKVELRAYGYVSAEVITPKVDDLL